MTERITESVEETLALGAAYARDLKPGDVVALDGDLGAGKTHFVKGVASAFGVAEADVTSPTFSIIQEYRGAQVTVYHIDAYRIEHEAELRNLGLEEVLYGDGICLVEWPSRLGRWLPMDAKRVEVGHEGGSKRRFRFI
jgi:tRNA threonylcarbamoyladenosine biosynthesis protein TsaE